MTPAQPLRDLAWDMCIVFGKEDPSEAPETCPCPSCHVENALLRGQGGARRWDSRAEGDQGATGQLPKLLSTSDADIDRRLLLVWEV